jgi:hypothetical protein
MGLNINPPLDVYEDVIVVDPVDNTVGFVGEGVQENHGSWSKAGDTRDGDSLWAWIPSGSKVTIESVKKQGWLIRGNMPLFYSGVWLVMGLRPGIHFYKFGIKDQTRVEVENKTFIINGYIRAKGREISNKEFLENYLPKKQEKVKEKEKMKQAAAGPAKVSNVIKEKVQQFFKDRKDTSPIIQIKMLFPLIELADKLFKKIPNRQNFKNYLYRTVTSIDLQIKSYHLFTCMEERIKMLDGEPIEKELAKNLTATLLRTDTLTSLGEGSVLIPLFGKAGLLLNVDRKASEGEKEYLKKMFSFTEPLVTYIMENKN